MSVASCRSRHRRFWEGGISDRPVENGEYRQRRRVPGCAAGSACAPSRHDSGQIERSTGQARKRRDRGDATELSARARADQARRLAGGRLRRGRARSAGRSRGGRGGGAGSQADSEGYRRFQTADTGAPRGAVRGNLPDRIVRGRLRIAGANRPRQYPARLAMGAGARGACPAGNAETCLRRRPRPPRYGLRLRRRHRRRRIGALDRGGPRSSPRSRATV